MAEGKRFIMQVPAQIDFPCKDPRVGDIVSFVVIDTATGVNYLCMRSPSGMALTPLIDGNEKPLATK